jgi:hypothetical protein
MKQTIEQDNRLLFEDPTDPDNTAIFVADEKGLIVTVAEDRLVDSSNKTFECSITLPREAVVALRGWLSQRF